MVLVVGVYGNRLLMFGLPEYELPKEEKAELDQLLQEGLRCSDELTQLTRKHYRKRSDDMALQYKKNRSAEGQQERLRQSTKLPHSNAFLLL